MREESLAGPGRPEVVLLDDVRRGSNEAFEDALGEEEDENRDEDDRQEGEPESEGTPRELAEFPFYHLRPQSTTHTTSDAEHEGEERHEPDGEERAAVTFTDDRQGDAEGKDRGSERESDGEPRTRCEESVPAPSLQERGDADGGREKRRSEELTARAPREERAREERETDQDPKSDRDAARD